MVDGGGNGVATAVVTGGGDKGRVDGYDEAAERVAEGVGGKAARDYHFDDVLNMLLCLREFLIRA